jgi:hypothetical protein
MLDLLWHVFNAANKGQYIELKIIITSHFWVVWIALFVTHKVNEDRPEITKKRKSHLP